MNSLKQETREQNLQLQHRLAQAERRLQERENTMEELEKEQQRQTEELRRQVEDLKLQLENTERQLKSNKHFLDVSRFLWEKSFSCYVRSLGALSVFELVVSHHLWVTLSFFELVAS